MPNNTDSPEKPENANNNEPDWRLTYTVIAGAALGGLGIIWAFCLYYIPQESDRVQIFLALCVNYLILMAMFVQAHITQRQWRAMQDQMRQTRELFDMAERPSLGLDQIWLDPDTSRVRAIFQNSGKAPANDVKFLTTAIVVGPKGSPLDLSAVQQEDIAGGLSPAPCVIAVNGNTLTKSEVLPLDELERIRNQELDLYAWITVRYKGLGPNEYILEYHARLEVTEAAWITCPTNNHAT